jgi:hypothetical protein
MALGLTFTVLLPKFLYFSAVSCEGKLTEAPQAVQPPARPAFNHTSPRLSSQTNVVFPAPRAATLPGNPF